MNIITMLATLSAIGAGLYLLSPSSAQAEPLPALQYVPVYDAWTGETWYEPQLTEPEPAALPAPVSEPFNPYIEVNIPATRMTDSDYNELLARYGLGPDGRPLPGETSQAERNLSAFLAVIRQIESANDYNALVGGGQFSNMADHPYFTGEWKGIRRSDDNRLTTAAGAYQFISTTWREVATLLGLPDFSPASQDAGAVQLLKRRGAYNDVLAGNFDRAALKLVKEWEAFERILAGQYPYTLAQIKQLYSTNGGAFA